MTKTPDASRNFMDWLQCLRGISLLLVLFYHVGNVVDLHLGDPRIVAWFGFGHCGVDIFFVISGFIMFYLHEKDFGKPERTTVYLKKRFVRIYPIYWLLTTAVLLPALFLSGSVKAVKLEPSHLLESYLLFPIYYSGLPIIPPGWSLFHEVKFYLFFALLILLRAPWHRVWLAAWSVACVTATAWIVYAQAPFETAWHFFWLGPYNLEFLAGCLTGWIMQKQNFSLRQGQALLGIGAVVLAAVAYQDVTADITLLALLAGYGISGVCLVMGCITLDVHAATAKRAPRWLAFVGDASYSAYLAHYPLLFFMAKAMLLVLGKQTANQYSIWAASFLLIACLAACLAVYKYVELPVIRQSRKWAGLGTRA